MDTIDIFALNLIKGLGKKSLFNIITSNYSIDDLVSMDDIELGQFIKGAGKYKAIDAISNHFDHYKEKSESEISNLQEDNIQLITYSDDIYPALYRKISDPPIFLYTKGNIDLLNYQKSIAIIGTRECSEIGRNIAFNTAKYFADNDYNIVSGLALGIDTAAHKGALEVKGQTTSIVTDVKEIYPKENIGLAEEIVNEDGLLVSENPPGVFPHRGLFVSRDRLQSGLSLAVFPIETDIKGGTMHTVNFSIGQNRLLFCPDLENIPKYPPNFSKSKGIFKLIDEGKAEAFSKPHYKNVIRKLELHEAKLWCNNDKSNVGEQISMPGV